MKKKLHERQWSQYDFVTNSRKHEDDYQCVAQLTAQDLQYIKLYPLQMCLLMSPPFTASTRGEQRQLALELWDVNTSDEELLTPSYAADAYSSNKCC